MMIMRVLVIEDEQKMADLIKRGLEAEAMSIGSEQVICQDDVFNETTKNNDLIILDLGLPDRASKEDYREQRSTKTSRRDFVKAGAASPPLSSLHHAAVLVTRILIVEDINDQHKSEDYHRHRGIKQYAANSLQPRTHSKILTYGKNHLQHSSAASVAQVRRP
jgi:CheY-like chemotaxis protein